MAEQSDPKWEGKAIVELSGPSAEIVWPALEDFCNIHKLIPIDTCYQLEGTPGQPGLIRYCASAVKIGDEETATIKWAKEKLLTMDPVQRYLSYEIVGSNMGFKSYVATLKVVPINDDGCKIEWSFVSDPIEGWSFQGLNSHIENYLKFMAKKIVAA